FTATASEFPCSPPSTAYDSLSCPSLAPPAAAASGAVPPAAPCRPRRRPRTERAAEPTQQRRTAPSSGSATLILPHGRLRTQPPWGPFRGAGPFAVSAVAAASDDDLRGH